MQYDHPTRRDAIRLALVAGATALSATSAVKSAGAEIVLPPTEETDRLTPYLCGGQVLLRWNNVVAAAYRANPIQKFPYFTDLAGPISGLSLTTESSLPFPHHRGLWLGCEPLNGGDYWHDGSLETGQVRSLDLQLGSVTTESAEIRNRCQWIRRGAPSPIMDERTITFRVLNDEVRSIDFDIHLTALQHLRISKAKHSFFAMRAAPDICPVNGGTLVNAEGSEGEAGTHGRPSAWCSYFGRHASRPDVVEGIAVMDHPKNPSAPCPWFTRDYGHLSPSPFNFLDQPWELREAASIRLRYRVVLHAGTPQEAGLDELFKEWVAA